MKHVGRRRRQTAHVAREEPVREKKVVRQPLAHGQCSLSTWAYAFATCSPITSRGEEPLHALQPALAEAGTQTRIQRQRPQPLGEAEVVIRLHYDTGIADHFVDSAAVSGENGFGGGHGLDESNSELFLHAPRRDAGQHEDVREPMHFGQLRIGLAARSAESWTRCRAAASGVRGRHAPAHLRRGRTPA